MTRRPHCVYRPWSAQSIPGRSGWPKSTNLEQAHRVPRTGTYGTLGVRHILPGGELSLTGRSQNPGQSWESGGARFLPNRPWARAIFLPVQHTPSSCRGLAPLRGRLTHGLAPPGDPIRPPEHLDILLGNDPFQLYTLGSSLGWVRLRSWSSS